MTMKASHPLPLVLAVLPQAAGDVAANLLGITAACEKAATSSACMVVFPEMQLTGYLLGADALHQKALTLEEALFLLSPLARKFDLCLVCGFAERTDAGFYVSALALGPEGLLAHYRKIHLGSPERGLYLEGDRPVVFSFMGLTFGLALCYDAHFPELFSCLAHMGAEVFLIPHASPRTTPEEKKASWLRHLPARAFDTGSYVLAVNPCSGDGTGKFFPGLALALGPDGRACAELFATGPGLLFLSLNPERVSAIRSHSMTAFHRGRRPDLYHGWMREEL